jgi:adenylyltransferase/sulfurtransferase
MQGDGPCYRCLFPAPPPMGLIPTCQEAGVLGPLVGTLGTILASEVVKHFAAVGESLEGSLLLVDALTASFRQVRVKRNPDCPLCGLNPTITELVESEHTCDSQER